MHNSQTLLVTLQPENNITK